MSDLNERLHRLTDVGSGPSLAAGEVRRLGDRRRRRRQTGIVTAAVAAVAAVVIPIVLTGSGRLGTAPPLPAAPTSTSSSTASTPSASTASAPSSTSPSTPPPAFGSTAPPQPPSTGATTTASTSDSTALTTFPLAQGVLANVDTTVRGPSVDAQGLDHDTVCGQGVWDPQDKAPRLALNASGPEYAESRELRVYTDANSAVVQMTRLATLAASCTQQPAPSGGTSDVTITPVATGWASLAWGSTATGSRGGDVFLFNRVGRAIVAIRTSGSYSASEVSAALGGPTDTAKALAAPMCRWTTAGCPTP